MRRLPLLLLSALAFAVTGCPNFGLGEREFLCDLAADCGDGFDCAAGSCVKQSDGGSVIDSGEATDAADEICDNSVDDDGDDLVDCQDPQCGVATCDDNNPCTNNLCLVDGRCSNTAVTDGTSCGVGCGCSGGLRTETTCNDLADNDGDSLVDCNDLDCPRCSNGTMCCANGSCNFVCF